VHLPHMHKSIMQTRCYHATRGVFVWEPEERIPGTGGHHLFQTHPRLPQVDVEGLNDPRLQHTRQALIGRSPAERATSKRP
jgi:hypothetical protein